MRFSSTALLAVLSAMTSVQADCTNDGGNYYCSKTSKVVYSGVGYSGLYKDVTAMDEDSGSCSQSTFKFSGNMSPLDEELSVHFRGPLKLLQFGVYYPAGGSKSKREEADCVQHAHHVHKRATQVVEVTLTVIVDGNAGPETSTTVATSTSGVTSPDPWAPSSASSGDSSASSSASSSDSDSSSSSSSSSSGSGSSSSGDWVKAAYYKPGSADNCTFLNYYGGSGSGVWSSSFGNSLSYANSDASGGSSKAVALSETTIDSNVEYIIMSGSKCSGDSCGFYREGIPAYHGFGGPEKIFVFEFEMPSASDSATYNYDMPAIWMLNAKIPRTLQYGDASCSCWKTGCGELDLFEILSSGSNKLISHLHDGQGNDGSSQGGGGSQDYFARPTSGSMKAAVIFTGDEIHVMEVDDFEEDLSSSTVSKWILKSGSKAQL